MFRIKRVCTLLEILATSGQGTVRLIIYDDETGSKLFYDLLQSLSPTNNYKYDDLNDPVQT